MNVRLSKHPLNIRSNFKLNIKSEWMVQLIKWQNASRSNLPVTPSQSVKGKKDIIMTKALQFN